MAQKTVDISISGEWHTVPAMEFNGHVIAVTGTWLKMAVIHDEEFLEGEFRDPELCVKQLKERRSDGLRADIFTFSQRGADAVSRFPYQVEWESIAAVDTSSFKKWWESRPQEVRKNVRRAEKRGVVVTVKQLDDQLIQDILDLNNDSPVRQGRAFVHYGKTLEQVRKDQAAFPERSDYVCAYFEKELIGFLKIAYRGDLASLVQILPRASHQDKRPANAMIAKAVEVCESKGVSHLTYGLFNYGNRQDSPLRQFKIRNGFIEMRVPRFYVPLTGWGAICTKLKLYRGLIGLLPDGVTRLGSNARAKWYDLISLARKPV